MAAAILINQVTLPAGVLGVAREDGVISQLVTCTSGTVATTYTWTLVDVPIRSALVRGTVGVGASFIFTPDVKGTYLVRLRLNGSSSSADNTASFIAVKSFGLWSRTWRYLAAREENIDNILRAGLGFPSNVNARGWATNQDLITEEIEQTTGRVLTAVTTSPGPGTDALVKIDPATGKFDPSVIPGAGSIGIKYHLLLTDTIIVPTDFQYLVQGSIIIDPGGSLTAAPGAQIVILP